MTEPQFEPGDRVFSHYVMGWGTIYKLGKTDRNQTHGVTGSRLPDTTWYYVKMDGGHTEYLDDAHGDWDMARIVPAEIARRNGYGADPKARLVPANPLDPAPDGWDGTQPLT